MLYTLAGQTRFFGNGADAFDLGNNAQRSQQGGGVAVLGVFIKDLVDIGPISSGWLRKYSFSTSRNVLKLRFAISLILPPIFLGGLCTSCLCALITADEQDYE